MILAVMMVLAVASTTAAAADSEIVPRYQPCIFCGEGAIRTTSTTKILGNTPISYQSCVVDGYLYSCPVWQTQTVYTTACTNRNCGAEYGTDITYGTVVKHVH